MDGNEDADVLPGHEPVLCCIGVYGNGGPGEGLVSAGGGIEKRRLNPDNQCPPLREDILRNGESAVVESTEPIEVQVGQEEGDFILSKDSGRVPETGVDFRKCVPPFTV